VQRNFLTSSGTRRSANGQKGKQQEELLTVYLSGALKGNSVQGKNTVDAHDENKRRKKKRACSSPGKSYSWLRLKLGAGNTLDQVRSPLRKKGLLPEKKVIKNGPGLQQERSPIRWNRAVGDVDSQKR